MFGLLFHASSSSFCKFRTNQTFPLRLLIVSTERFWVLKSSCRWESLHRSCKTVSVLLLVSAVSVAVLSVFLLQFAATCKGCILLLLLHFFLPNQALPEVGGTFLFWQQQKLPAACKLCTFIACLLLPAISAAVFLFWSNSSTAAHPFLLQKPAMAKNKKAMKPAAKTAFGRSSAAAETTNNAAATVQPPPTKPASAATTAGKKDVAANTADIRSEDKLPATKNAEKKMVSFAGLFSTNCRLTEENKLTKYAVDDGPLTLGSDDLLDVRTKLGFCHVGYIAGKFPGLKAIRALSQSWGASFQQYESGWLIFRFPREEDGQRVLAGGPYFVYGRPLLLKHMPECFEFKEDDISLTPVWATLPLLPLECWHPTALEKIGSRLGTPIAMDTLTMKMERVSYVRILVEVDASQKLKDEVEFVMPNGITRKQSVVYEFTPKFCTSCNRFEHLQETCQGLTAVPPVVVPAAASPAAAPTKPAEAAKNKPAEWTIVHRRNKGKTIATAAKPTVEVQQPPSPPAGKVEQGRQNMKAPQPRKPEDAVVPSPADSVCSSADSSTTI
ncbi:UNVERIFIED_CONTAM: hypothetical protein Sindi_1415200 [Sesamum indicum]